MLQADRANEPIHLAGEDGRAGTVQRLHAAGGEPAAAEHLHKAARHPAAVEHLAPASSNGAQPSAVPPVRTIVVDRTPVPAAPLEERRAVRPASLTSGPERL